MRHLALHPAFRSGSLLPQLALLQAWSDDETELLNLRYEAVEYLL